MTFGWSRITTLEFCWRGLPVHKARDSTHNLAASLPARKRAPSSAAYLPARLDTPATTATRAAAIRC
jgi:hypothetical protein